MVGRRLSVFFGVYAAMNTRGLGSLRLREAIQRIPWQMFPAPQLNYEC